MGYNGPPPKNAMGYVPPPPPPKKTMGQLIPPMQPVNTEHYEQAWHNVSRAIAGMGVSASEAASVFRQLSAAAKKAQPVADVSEPDEPTEQKPLGNKRKITFAKEQPDHA